MRRALWAALVATVLAGAVGVVRQRAETARARREGAGRAAVGPRYGRLGRWLAEWVPSRPATFLGRVAAAVWSAPLTAVGLLVAVASGGRPRWSDELGCFLVEEVRGMSATALRSVGAEANAIGQVVLSSHARSSDALLAHEAVHVRQAERFGALLFPLYVWLAARYGYRHHPLEQAARRGARRAVGGPPAG